MTTCPLCTLCLSFSALGTTWTDSVSVVPRQYSTARGNGSHDMDHVPKPPHHPPKTESTTFFKNQMPDDDILDAINEGRFASAKRDLAGKLKRFPNKSYYWALNCYLLLASGDAKQAEKECRVLKGKVPSDPDALEVLEMTFRKLELRQDAVEVWENAIKKYPTTKLILMWFDKALRRFDTRHMQKASMMLQKHAKSNPEYGVWASFCNYLWSNDTAVEKEQSLHLSLAAGLIEKAKPLENNQHIFVLVSILAKKNDFAGIVEVLLPLKHKELELTLIHLDALDRLEDWSGLRDVTKTLLFDEDFNDFDTWKYFIKASKNLDVQKSELVQLITLGSRNSYMANIEICRVYESGLDEAIDAYYEKFSSKPCCPLDLSNYALSQTFLDAIAQQSTEMLAKDALTGKDITFVTNVERIQIQRDQAYTVDWNKFAKFKNPELSDLYLICMIQDLQQNWTPDRLVKHIIQLRHYSKEDPENFNVNVWLLNLYKEINVSSLASKEYKDLKIKMIQHDLFLYKLQLEPTLGNLNDLIQIYRFYLTGDGEVDALVGKAFDQQLFMNMEDFLAFGKRFSSSLSRHLLLLKITKIARTVHKDYYNFFYRKLKEQKGDVFHNDFSVSDNRDFKTEYNLGVQLPHLAFQDKEKAKGKEYVQLHYVKEFLIMEQDDVEIGKLFKLFNRWLSNPAYTKQLSAFENHMFKLYLGLFKLAKVKDPKDRMLQLNFLTKNLDFKKVKQAFLSKLPPLSGDINAILVDLIEITGLIRGLTKDAQLLEAAKKLDKDIGNYKSTSEQIEYLKSLRGSLSVSNLSELFVEDQLESIEDGLRKSAVHLH